MKKILKASMAILLLNGFVAQAIEVDGVQSARESIRSICSCLDASSPNSRSSNCASITPNYFNPFPNSSGPSMSPGMMNAPHSGAMMNPMMAPSMPAMPMNSGF